MSRAGRRAAWMTTPAQTWPALCAGEVRGTVERIQKPGTRRSYYVARDLAGEFRGVFPTYGDAHVRLTGHLPLLMAGQVR